MNRFLGPLDSAGRIPPLQQTRVSSFLISVHGAVARQLLVGLPGQFNAGWQTELNSQFHRETEIVSLLMRATAWRPDFTLPYLVLNWETSWLPKPVGSVADQRLATIIDIAALGHAVHGVIRPAALLPIDASAGMPVSFKDSLTLNSVLSALRDISVTRKDGGTPSV